MERANRKRWAGAALVAVALALLLQAGGRRPVEAMSHAAGAVPCSVPAASSLRMAGMQLSLKIEFDTPSGCALARTLWQVIAPFTSGNGE